MMVKIEKKITILFKTKKIVNDIIESESLKWIILLILSVFFKKRVYSSGCFANL